MTLTSDDAVTQVTRIVTRIMLYMGKPLKYLEGDGLAVRK